MGILFCWWRGQKNRELIVRFGGGMEWWLPMWNRVKRHYRTEWSAGVSQPVAAIWGPSDGFFGDDIGNRLWSFRRDHHLDICGKCPTCGVDIIGSLACIRDAWEGCPARQAAVKYTLSDHKPLQSKLAKVIPNPHKSSICSFICIEYVGIWYQKTKT